MAPPCAPEAVETLIFVDVDGVLNTGARSQDEAPLLIDEWNLKNAVAMRSRRDLPRADQDCIDKLVSVSERPIGWGEGGTYKKFACGPGSHISVVLAARLARILQKAGEQRLVVLSSNWRRPQSAKQVACLEAEVSKHLGRPFCFDARTKQIEEKHAADRLRCIGDYVEDFCRSSQAGAHSKTLKVLVLEDFFISPLNGWGCDGTTVKSVAEAEAYLRGRAPAATKLEAKLVHTYDEWTTPSGLRVQIGTGLTLEHVLQAEDFLTCVATECPLPQQETPVTKEPTTIARAIRGVPSPCKAGKSKGRYMTVAWPWFSMHLTLHGQHGH